MLVSLDKDTAINPEHVATIQRCEHDRRYFDATVIGEGEPRTFDAREVEKLAIASAPIVPAQSATAALYASYDMWGLPVIVDRPVIAWRILPEGAQPIIGFAPRDGRAPDAYLTPGGMVLLQTGETMRPQAWGMQLVLEKAKADGRVLDAPTIETDPLA